MNIREPLRGGFARLPPKLRRDVLHLLGKYAPWEEEFDFTGPTLAPGESSGPPSFVGIGAQKAGTTWWYELMSTHPDIASRDDIHKERHFFDRFGARAMRASEIDQYHRWFPRPAGMLTGEWTPDYLSFPWVPPLLQRAAPDARLLVLLRDPVERFRSGLDHLQAMGGRRDGAAISDTVQRGFYFRSLQVWLDHFDPEQLLVLQYEQCLVDRDRQLDATFAHLGLAPHHPPERDRPESTRRVLDDQVREYLVSVYAPDVASLAASRPGIDLALWPNFAYLTGSTAPPASDGNSPSRRP
jgi:hypothetical protein